MRNPYGSHPTRFPQLTFSRISPKEWSFFATEENDPKGWYRNRVGPLYASSAELLADLARYARDSWGLEA